MYTHHDRLRVCAMLLFVCGTLLMSQMAVGGQPEASDPLLKSPQLVSNDQAQEAGITNRYSRRISKAIFDVSALFDTPLQDGKAPEISTPAMRQTVTMEPFPGEQFVVKGRYVEQWKADSWTWVGEVVGHEHADFVLSVTPLSHYGVLRVGPILYEVRKGRDGETYIREPDVAAYNMESSCALGLHDHGSDGLDGDLLHETAKHDVESRGMEMSGFGSPAVIDILLLYSSAAASNYDIEALANNSIASMNTSFDDGGIDAVARIVHYSLVSGYVEEPEMNQPDIIDVTVDMRFGNGDFSGVPSLRSDHDADLAILLWDGSKSGDTCGSAYVPSTSSGDSNLFTGNTGDSCIAMFNNFTHEIGHNLGADHDYPGSGAYSYSNGYSFAGDAYTPEFRTIMGSDYTCSVYGCDRLNLWSDPNEQYYSEAIGDSTTANNVQSNNSMTGVIGGYKTPSGSSPGAMGTVVVTRGYCYDQNFVDWSAPSGFLGWYEMQTDANSSFLSPTTEYRGSEDSTLYIPVMTETWVRVRACNSVGCNSWQSGDQTAKYYSACL